MIQIRPPALSTGAFADIRGNRNGGPPKPLGERVPFIHWNADEKSYTSPTNRIASCHTSKSRNDLLTGM